MYEQYEHTGRPGNGSLGGSLANQYQPGTINASAQTSRDTVQQALDEQEKHLAELHQCLTALRDRLGNVLGPDQLEKDPNTAPPTPTNVLARIRDHSRAIGFATQRLSDLMQRLQL